MEEGDRGSHEIDKRSLLSALRCPVDIARSNVEMIDFKDIGLLFLSRDFPVLAPLRKSLQFPVSYLSGR